MQDTHGCEGLQTLDHPDQRTQEPMVHEQHFVRQTPNHNIQEPQRTIEPPSRHDPRGPSKLTRITTKVAYPFSLGPTMTRTTQRIDLAPITTKAKSSSIRYTDSITNTGGNPNPGRADR